MSTINRPKSQEIIMSKTRSTFRFLISGLALNLMFFSTGFANWTEVSRPTKATIYVDLDSAIDTNGPVYFKVLINFSRADKWGDLSSTIDYQGDCASFRLKALKLYFYKVPMGRGAPHRESIPNMKLGTWYSPHPRSPSRKALSAVCNR